MKGKLFLVEGLDRCGKDTQIQLLLDKVLNSVKYNFPNELIETGQKLRKYLNKEIELTDIEVNNLFALDRQKTMPLIVENLTNGQNVFLSRYAFSGVAYTSAKGTCSIDEAIEPDIGILIPSLTILLYQNPKTIEDRYSNQDRYENAEYQAKVLQKFIEISKMERVGKWLLVNCLDKSIQQIHTIIYEAIQEELNSDKPVEFGLFE